jgi:hypothetical protein
MTAGVDAARRAGVLILVLVCLLSLAWPGRALAQGSCAPDATRLCLSGNRFQAEVAWTVPGLGSGEGHAVPLTADTGSFWFFSNSNLELIVKVLDGRAVNRHFWVFYGGLSDVEYTLTVTDTATGARETYTNPAHRLASAADVSAFDVEAPPAAPAAPAAPRLVPAAPALRQGPELQVNVTTQGFQDDPGVAVGPGGRSMVVWTGPSLAGGDPRGGANVYGRLYDPAGRPTTGEIRLNGAEPAAGARVAAGPAGEFMVVWNGESYLTGRVYGPDGQPLGGEVRIARLTDPRGEPAIVADPAGGFLVAWPDFGSTTLHLPGSLLLQRLSARGTLVGNEILITRSGGGLRLAASPLGGFLMTWIESSGDLEADVRALRLDALARPIGTASLRVNIDSVRHAGYPQGAAPVFHADGGFSVVWSNFVFPGYPGTEGLFARSYAADGTPAGDVVELRPGGSIANSAPAAVVLSSGAVVVLWYEEGRPEDLDGGLFGRLYDASWNPLGDDFRVNTFTPDSQTGPAAAPDGSGGFLTAWTSGVEPWVVDPLPPGWEQKGQDGSYLGVFAQRFTTATCALSSGELCLGGRFRVAVQFTDPRSGTSGAGQAIPLTSDTGAFWFFDPANVELILKVLDGRAVNGHFWVFAGALSDVAYTITVTDTQSGTSRIYHNAPHQLASRADVEAF